MLVPRRPLGEELIPNNLSHKSRVNGITSSIQIQSDAANLPRNIKAALREDIKHFVFFRRKIKIAELAISCAKRPCLPESQYLKLFIDLRNFLLFLASASHSTYYKRGGFFIFNCIMTINLKLLDLSAHSS